jgi:hypothetical protein
VHTLIISKAHEKALARAGLQTYECADKKHTGNDIFE